MLTATGDGGTLVRAAPGQVARCRLDNGEVRARQTHPDLWQWVHLGQAQCDDWAEEDTPWHVGWKAAGNCEVPYRGQRLADLVALEGTVCELQQQPLTAASIRDREAFYGTMRWLFDARDRGYELSQGRDGNGHIARSPQQWPAIALPTSRVMLDLGEHVMSVHRVSDDGTWAFGYLYPPATVRRWLAVTPPVRDKPSAVGPCCRCGSSITRYGPAGRMTCSACNPAGVNARYRIGMCPSCGDPIHWQGADRTPPCHACAQPTGPRGTGANLRAWQVTLGNLVDVTTGPCGGCGHPMERFGANGQQVCDGCLTP